MTQALVRPITAAVILLLIAAWLSAEAQRPHVARIGLIQTGSLATSGDFVDAFRQRLRELGYVEGRSIIIEVRYADDVRYAVSSCPTSRSNGPDARVARIPPLRAALGSENEGAQGTR